LYAALRGGSADLVQGRRVSKAGVRDLRYFLSRGLNAVLNLAFGMHLRDNKSGFVLGSRQVMSAILDHRFRYRYFQALLLVSAHSKGYSIAEIDTEFGKRKGGSSFMSMLPLNVIWGCLVDIVKGFVEFRLIKPRGIASPGT